MRLAYLAPDKSLFWLQNENRVVYMFEVIVHLMLRIYLKQPRRFKKGVPQPSYLAGTVPTGACQ